MLPTKRNHRREEFPGGSQVLQLPVVSRSEGAGRKLAICQNAMELASTFLRIR